MTKKILAIGVLGYIFIPVLIAFIYAYNKKSPDEDAADYNATVKIFQMIWVFIVAAAIIWNI